MSKWCVGGLCLCVSLCLDLWEPTAVFTGWMWMPHTYSFPTCTRRTSEHFSFRIEKKKKEERRSAINEHPKYQQLPRCPLTQPLRIKPCLSNRLSPLQRAAFAVKRFFIKRGLPRALGWWLRVISQLGVWATGSGPVQGHPHLHKNRQEVLKKGSWWVFGRLDMKIQHRKWLIMSQQPERL